jgi:hypothetical protein
MMEWWKNGILGLKMEIILMLFSELRKVTIKDLILLNPLFQHSSIPAPLGLYSWYSQLSLI